MSLTLLSFTPGTTIVSSQVNSNFGAIAGILNGTTSANIILIAPNNSSVPLQVLWPTAPASDFGGVVLNVTGDAQGRATLYVRGSDGYGGLLGGAGPSVTAHMYAQANGWNFQEGIVAGSFGSLFQLVISNSAPGSPVTNQTVWIDTSVSL